MATITDVARAAGVSASTVSYVLSGKRAISPATRARVLDAVDRLGYRPHAGARALASSRAHVIGLVAPLHEDADVGIVMEFVRSVTTTARRHDDDVLLLTSEDPGALERVTAASLVDGLVVMDIEVEDPRTALLARLGRPSVLIGLPRDARGLSCVDFDFARAARSAVHHLARLGHRRVGLVSASASSVHRAGYVDRLRSGFLEAAGAAGVEVATEPCDPAPASARACLAALRAALPGLTALVVHHEAALPHLLDALAAEGTRLPEDLSLVAVGAADPGGRALRPVDAIEVPVAEVGRVAVEMLAERTAGSTTSEVRLLSAPLVERGTTAPPPRAGQHPPSGDRHAR
ncbi:LacI family DNA-binding transcriptional regulator [Kineococcus sp. SYSU DK005]|uniref:LacI family DNA-binding transcriptional regulator n=1 Tax=Kineococcus sp. SYSU DK005 TaxID=3383126 RepID=UPI003D7E6DE4